jgi:hypothetical protein
VKGLAGLLEFLALLRSKKIQFSLQQQRDDALMVSFALVGVRIEVEFFDDHIEFSTFKGSEAVESDETLLMKLISENWD